MAEHNVLGRRGEEVAATFLERKGHRILERNWSRSGYEIDLITEEQGYIVFVEVKSRSSLKWGLPSDAVDRHRMKRMISAASLYLKQNRIDLPARFDIVSLLRDGNTWKVEHIEDAFLPFL